MLRLVSLILFLLGTSLSLASDERQAKVRVGFFPYPDFQEVNENGEYSGVGYELLQRLKVYTGWQYEYIGLDGSWADAPQLFRDGKMDLLMCARKTPALTAVCDFSLLPLDYVHSILTIRAGNDAFLPEDYGNWKPMRVGMLKGWFGNPELEELAKRHGFVFKPVIFEDLQQLSRALGNDVVDAVWSCAQRRITNEWVLLQGRKSPWYIAISNNAPDLRRQLESALDTLKAEWPDCSEQLKKKHFPAHADAAGMLPLSRKELDYLKELRSSEKRLKIAVFLEHSQMCFMEDGKLKGILGDVLADMEECLSLSFDIMATESVKTYRSLLRKGQVDLLLDAHGNHALAEKAGYVLFKPYMFLRYIKVHRKDFEGVARNGAVVTNPGVSETLAALVPNLGELVSYDTCGEVLEAVRSGYQNIGYVSSTEMQDDVLRKYSHVLMLEYPEWLVVDYGLGLRETAPPELYGIMRKLTQYLENRRRDGVASEHTCVLAPQNGLKQLFRRHVILVLAMGCGAAGGILLALLALLSYIRTTRQAHLTQTLIGGLNHVVMLLREAEAWHEQHLNAEPQPMDELALQKGKNTANTAIGTAVADISSLATPESSVASRLHCQLYVRDELNTVVSMFEGAMTEKKLQFIMDVPELPRLALDRRCFRYVFLEILNNAMKFTSAGTIMTVVRFIRHSDKLGDLQLIVKDTGSGMTKDDLMQLTGKSFFNYKGHLQKCEGLRMVKWLLNRMKGTLHLTSAVGRGTNVEVRFTNVPIIPAVQGKEAGVMGFASEEPEKNTRLLPTLMLVDDVKPHLNQMNATCLRANLKTIILAHSGEEALEQLEQQHVDIVLTDLSMAEMNGEELARNIRQRYQGMHLEIYAATADKEAQRSFDLTLFHTVFPKPITLEMIQQIVDDWKNRSTTH